MAQGRDAMTFEERQQLLRLVVEGITVENGLVRVETIIPTGRVQDQLRYACSMPVEPRTHPSIRLRRTQDRQAQDERESAYAGNIGKPLRRQPPAYPR